MKTYILNIIPNIKKFSQKLDNLTLITDQHWVLYDPEGAKQVYIFRKNNELLISVNGIVSKGKWEYLGNTSLLIELNDQTLLLRNEFFDDSLLSLKIDGMDGYILFVNEIILSKGIDNLEALNLFLSQKYSQVNKVSKPDVPVFYPIINCAECNNFPCICPKEYWEHRTVNQCPACGFSEKDTIVLNKYTSCPDCGLKFI